MAKTKTSTLFYGKSKVIEAEGCFGITFYRPTGSNPVSVSGFPIAEGQSYQIQQNVGDTDTSRYEITFFSGSGSNQLYVIKILPSC